MKSSRDSDGWTEAERAELVAYDEALAIREEGSLDRARDLCLSLLNRLGPNTARLTFAVHLELGHLEWNLGNLAAACDHFTRASKIAPRSELASLGMFHTLVDQSRWEEGLREIVRFVSVKYSPAYAELLAKGFRADLLPSHRALADEARSLLAAHLSKS